MRLGTLHKLFALIPPKACSSCHIFHLGLEHQIIRRVAAELCERVHGLREVGNFHKVGVGGGEVARRGEV